MLELRAALQQFLPYLEGKYVLVRSDNQSPGGTELTAPPQTGSGALAVGSDPLSATVVSTHPRGPEPGNGHALEKWPAGSGLESTPPGGATAVGKVLESAGGSVCISGSAREDFENGKA